MNRIIFILPNIYESVNGVSTKYMKFIDYLKAHSYNIILFTTFKNKEILVNNTDTFKVIRIKGLNIPFYQEIKIPILPYEKIKDEIKDGNEIIIFNGEFLWIYETLKRLKEKHGNLKLYPTMHTDYVFYNNIYKNINITPLLNNLNIYLENKTFTGIIVTGENMKERYRRSTEAIFNANEVSFDIFKTHKIDTYDSKSLINIIYTGRVSKEKNLEEFFDCALELSKKYSNIIINIIGDGPYVDNLKSIIDINYKDIKLKTVFHGKKSQQEINDIYLHLDNRIFLFTSLSETFGKTPMEACATGIPIFIKRNEVSNSLYISKKNAFLFDTPTDFVQSFEYFMALNPFEKKIFIADSMNNIKKYDQNCIFDDWIKFLENDSNRNKSKNTLFNFLSFYGLSKLINCTGHMIGD